MYSGLAKICTERNKYSQTLVEYKLIQSLRTIFQHPSTFKMHKPFYSASSLVETYPLCFTCTQDILGYPWQHCF